MRIAWQIARSVWWDIRHGGGDEAVLALGAVVFLALALVATMASLGGLAFFAIRWWQS